MRIACLQFAPQVGDIENNLNRADAVLSRADIDELDLMVLPELAFTGYNFKSLQEIAPYLEPSGSGITSLWARTMALKYECTVLAGYPEKVDVAPKWPTGPEYYNSAIVVNPDGETIANYRKSFLYYTDQSWALEGNGFYSGFIPGLGNTSIGICMDINPYKFEAPWNAYEFAFHALEVQANLVIVSMAWMTRDEPREFSRMPNEPDMDTLTYWVTRLEPLIRAEDSTGEIIVVFANRTGIEGDATYAGTSAVLGIHNGEVSVYGLLGRGQKELLVVDTSQPPYGKLVYRPEHLGHTSLPKDQVKNASSNPTPPDSRTASASDKEKSPTSGRPIESGSPEKERNAPDQLESTSSLVGGGENPVTTQSTNAATDTITLTGQTMDDVDQRQDSELAKAPEEASNDTPGNFVKEVQKQQPTRIPPVAPISIPENHAPDSSANGVTPGADGTPTAAETGLNSPRTAVRPKLVIPISPNMAPQQLYPDQPISAASVMSAKSIQSIKSNESEASIQTVRSNPRPPEDSTPYPHSGMPLSGYPRKKQIYGGFVTISSEDVAPITPFEDMSPTSAMSWGWPHSANPFSSRTPGGGWRLRTPVGSVPEPFPWAAIRGSSRPRSRSTSRANHIASAMRQPTPPVLTNGSKSPEPGTAVKQWHDPSKSIERPETESDSAAARPASPKSRNASRSRPQERSNSAMGIAPDYAAAARHLENVSERVNSVSRTRDQPEHADSKSYFDSDSLPESRGTSPPKIGNGTINPELGNGAIPIAASPSLVMTEPQRKMMVPTPVALDYYRSVSTTTKLQNSPSLSSSSKPGELPKAKPNDSERSPSRGRQRDPKPFSEVPDSDQEGRVRSTSVDSTRNDLLHRHVRRVSANGGSQMSRNHSHTIQVPEGYKPEDFERVEEIACPNCPVHGRRSSSASNPVGVAADGRMRSQNRPRRRRSTSQGTSAAHQSPAPEMIQLQPRPGQPEMRQAEPRAEPRAILGHRSAPTPMQRPKRVHQKVSRGFASSPIPRPSTAPLPLPFNPPTPKAMAYIPVADELESLDEDDFVLSTTMKGKLVERGKGLGMELPVAA